VVAAAGLHSPAAGALRTPAAAERHIQAEEPRTRAAGRRIRAVAAPRTPAAGAPRIRAPAVLRIRAPGERRIRRVPEDIRRRALADIRRRPEPVDIRKKRWWRRLRSRSHRRRAEVDIPVEVDSPAVAFPRLEDIPAGEDILLLLRMDNSYLFGFSLVWFGQFFFLIPVPSPLF